ncbi:MAG: cell division protein ZapB [Planctomycetota bacterium]
MAAPSVLFIGSSRSVGFDPSGKGRLTIVPSDASGDIGLSIEALLAAMPGRQRQVFVLSTEVWSQIVPVESRSLRRIDKSQIPQMLAFEAESLSGIPASGARTSLELVEAGPLETTYWVSQIDAARFAQAADAIAFNGGKMLGMLHPAGLASSLTATRGEWSRIEKWDDLTVAVIGRGKGKPQRRFLADVESSIDTPATARDYLTSNGVNSAAWIEFLRDAAGTEAVGASILTGNQIPASPGSETGAYDLALESDLRVFLECWSTSLRKPSGIPVIVPIRQQASPRTKRTMALAATAAALVGVALHSQLTTRTNAARVESLRSQIQELQDPIDAFSQRQQELAELREDVVEAEARQQRLQTQMVRYRGQLAIHRSRMASLLRAIEEQQRPYDLSIDRIEGDGSQLRLVGYSRYPNEVIQFAYDLAQRLAPLNLSIQVPRREALLLTKDGGPYMFEYLVTDGA